MAKGIDQKFVHYGIRKDDLAMIESICDQEGIDFEWMSDEISKHNVHRSMGSDNCCGNVRR